MNQGLRINKQYLIFLILFYFFIAKDWLEQYWSVVGYGDEIIALLAIPIFAIKLCRNQFLVKIYRGVRKVRCSLYNIRTARQSSISIPKFL